MKTSAISFSIAFVLTTLARIFFGIFVDKVSWFKPFLTPLIGFSIFFGVVAVLLIVAELISNFRRK